MYVLILTLVVKVFNAGMGGVAMQEFDSYEACMVAAKEWKQEVKSRGLISNNELMAICVKK